jgi:hypothetical protein
MVQNNFLHDKEIKINVNSVRNALRQAGAVRSTNKTVRLPGEKKKKISFWAVRNTDFWGSAQRSGRDWYDAFLAQK